MGVFYVMIKMYSLSYNIKICIRILKFLCMYAIWKWASFIQLFSFLKDKICDNGMLFSCIREIFCIKIGSYASENENGYDLVFAKLITNTKQKLPISLMYLNDRNKRFESMRSSSNFSSPPLSFSTQIKKRRVYNNIIFVNVH